jgi:two-component system response regulator AdeR
LLLFKPDLVILDMKMPGMNGYEVAQKIKRSANCEHTKIIGVSAYFEDQDKDRLMEIGVECCFDKPFNSAELIEKAKAVLGA